MTTVSGTTCVALAIICHEANRAFCAFLGDTSQKPWSEAPDWQRTSAVNGVQFHIENPDAGDAASHDSWMAEKVAAGWVYGETKDEQQKTHPCIVPFDQLPADQQFKDSLFRAIVHAAVDGEASAVGVISAVGEQLAEARASLSGHKAASTRQRNVAAALREKLNPTPRKIAPLPATKDEGEAADRRDRVVEALAGDYVDVVASDGKKEILALAPQRVTGDAWRQRADGHLLAMPIVHDGADLDRPEVLIRGYGLFDAAGEMAGYRPLPEPIRVGKGQRTRVENSIIF